jgi:hypothetical protein
MRRSCRERRDPARVEVRRQPEVVVVSARRDVVDDSVDPIDLCARDLEARAAALDADAASAENGSHDPLPFSKAIGFAAAWLWAKVAADTFRESARRVREIRSGAATAKEAVDDLGVESPSPPLPSDHVLEALGRRMTDETLPRSERMDAARAALSLASPLVERAVAVLRPHRFVRELMTACLREIVEEKPS